MRDHLEYLQNQVQFSHQQSANSEPRGKNNNYFANLQHFNNIDFYESQDNQLSNFHAVEAVCDIQEEAYQQQDQLFQDNTQQSAPPFTSGQDAGQDSSNTSTTTANKQQVLNKQATKKLYEPLLDNGQVYVYEDDPLEYKKARKRIQNRHSARKVRGIQKNTTINLESQWENLQKENYEFRIQIADLTASNKLLSEEIAYFRSILKPTANGKQTYQDHNHDTRQVCSKGAQDFPTQQQQVQPYHTRQDYTRIEQEQDSKESENNNNNNNCANNRDHLYNSRQYENTEEPNEFIGRDNQDEQYLPYTATRTDSSRKGFGTFNSYQLFALALISCLFMLGYSGSTSDEGQMSARQQHYNVVLQYEQSINSVKDISQKILQEQLAASARYLVEESKQFEGFKILVWTLGIAGYIAYAVFVVVRHFKTKQKLNKEKRQ